MSDLVDPGKGARRQARKQAELLKRQKQKETLKAAEAEDELVKKRSSIMKPKGVTGRLSLLSPQTRRQSLG